MGLMNMIGMKRSRDSEFDSVTAMANCLMILSGAGVDQFQVLSSFTNHHQINPSRVFECKTCNRQFSSFQALGGHRASHKKPKLGGDLSLHSGHMQASPAKPKAHECSICGQEFAVGQALGGHMRRHRAAAATSAAVSDGSSDDHSPPAVKTNKKRVWGLDLNLTPLENDDLEFGLGKRFSTAAVNCAS